MRTLKHYDEILGVDGPSMRMIAEGLCHRFKKAEPEEIRQIYAGLDHEDKTFVTKVFNDHFDFSYPVPRENQSGPISGEGLQHMMEFLSVHEIPDVYITLLKGPQAQKLLGKHDDPKLPSPEKAWDSLVARRQAKAKNIPA